MAEGGRKTVGVQSVFGAFWGGFNELEQYGIPNSQQMKHIFYETLLWPSYIHYKKKIITKRCLNFEFCLQDAVPITTAADIISIDDMPDLVEIHAPTSTILHQTALMLGFSIGGGAQCYQIELRWRFKI